MLRRILRVSGNSRLAPLFTELGVHPIKYRRLLLALGYLRYLLSLPADNLASVALQANVNLFLRSPAQTCWLGDLEHALSSLHIPVHLPRPLSSLSPDAVKPLIHAVRHSMVTELQSKINSSSSLSLLHNRLEPLDPDSDSRPKSICVFLRHYLHRVQHKDHRLTLTKTLLGEHSFLANHHWVSRTIPSWSCRSCGTTDETPAHVLIQCTGCAQNDTPCTFGQIDGIGPCLHRRINSLRHSFFLHLNITYDISIPSSFTPGYAEMWLKKLIFDWNVVIPTARFIHLHYLLTSGRRPTAGWTLDDDLVEEELDTDLDRLDHGR